MKTTKAALLKENRELRTSMTELIEANGRLSQDRREFKRDAEDRANVNNVLAAKVEVLKARLNEEIERNIDLGAMVKLTN